MGHCLDCYRLYDDKVIWLCRHHFFYVAKFRFPFCFCFDLPWDRFERSVRACNVDLTCVPPLKACIFGCCYASNLRSKEILFGKCTFCSSMLPFICICIRLNDKESVFWLLIKIYLFNIKFSFSTCCWISQ